MIIGLWSFAKHITPDTRRPVNEDKDKISIKMNDDAAVDIPPNPLHRATLSPCTSDPFELGHPTIWLGIARTVATCSFVSSLESSYPLLDGALQHDHSVPVLTCLSSGYPPPIYNSRASNPNIVITSAPVPSQLCICSHILLCSPSMPSCHRIPGLELLFRAVSMRLLALADLHARVSKEDRRPIAVYIRKYEITRQDRKPAERETR
jgi:hypothetical protein